MRGRSHIQRGAGVGTADRVRGVCDGSRTRESPRASWGTGARRRGRAVGRLAWFLPCSVRRDLREAPLSASALAGHSMVAPRGALRVREERVRCAACARGAVRVYSPTTTWAPCAAACRKENRLWQHRHAPYRSRTRPVANAQRADRPVNVGDLERWLSLLGGGLLALYTLRRSLGTVVLLGGAGALLYRGWTGHCALYQTMGLSTVAHDAAPDSTRSVAGPDEHH